MGTADVVPVVLDNEVILFVQRGGKKLIGIDFSVNTEKHAVEDFNMLNPDILREGGGVIQLAYARNPETRVYMVMADGTMRVMLRDISENILGWSRITIRRDSGVAANVLSVAVLPSEDEDRVYITIDAGAAGRCCALLHSAWPRVPANHCTMTTTCSSHHQVRPSRYPLLPPSVMGTRWQCGSMVWTMVIM